MTTSPDISAELRALHDHYVEAVNLAVAADDDRRAQRLAEEFDAEVLDTVRRQLAVA